MLGFWQFILLQRDMEGPRGGLIPSNTSFRSKLHVLSELFPISKCELWADAFTIAICRVKLALQSQIQWPANIYSSRGRYL
jgi:hypothetical protein